MVGRAREGRKFGFIGGYGILRVYHGKHYDVGIGYFVFICAIICSGACFGFICWISEDCAARRDRLVVIEFKETPLGDGRMACTAMADVVSVANIVKARGCLRYFSRRSLDVKRVLISLSYHVEGYSFCVDDEGDCREDATVKSIILP